MAQHALQRLASPSRSLSLLLHITGTASFAYNFHFLTVRETPVDTAYGWHFQFLTILGLSASLLAFAIGILGDITTSPTLFKAKNVVAIVATPVEVVISILYWGIALIDPALVVPEDLALPILPDMGFHLAPAVFLTLDLILFSPPWTIPTYGTMTLAGFLAFCYWHWVEFCFSRNGWYPYPIFALLEPPQRMLLFAFSAVLVTGSTVALKWLYGFVNGYEDIRKAALKPLKKVQ